MTVPQQNLRRAGFYLDLPEEIRAAFRAMRSSEAATRMATWEIRCMAESRWMFERSSPIAVGGPASGYYGRIMNYPEPR